jgi:phosphotransferase system IIA component
MRTVNACLLALRRRKRSQTRDDDARARSVDSAGIAFDPTDDIRVAPCRGDVRRRCRTLHTLDRNDSRWKR